MGTWFHGGNEVDLKRVIVMSEMCEREGVCVPLQWRHLCVREEEAIQQNVTI